MLQERFDAIVVGAGPAGCATAYTLAKGGMKVLQIERGEYPGSKNVQGAILYSDALEKIIPDFREDAPLERHVIEQRIWAIDDASYVGMQYRYEEGASEKPNRYTIIRAQFDKWFSRKAREAGAVLLCETTVTDLVKDEKGRVIGVKTDRDDESIGADVVVLADGVNGLVGQRAAIRKELTPSTVALAVKEMHFLPEETIAARFNLKDSEGVVIEVLGAVTQGMVGTGFLYTNRESISVGIGCLVGDFVDTGATPYDLLERFKSHPAVKPLLEGSEVREYSAHLIPEGGYRAIPQLFGDGWLVVGDSGHFVNGMHREGSNMAMTTGQIAAQTILELKSQNAPFNAKNLAEYKKKLEATYVMKDLKKYKDLPKFMHDNKYFMDVYPRLLNYASKVWFRVDGVDKLTKEREILDVVKKRRKFSGVFGDAFKMMRAWR